MYNKYNENEHEGGKKQRITDVLGRWSEPLRDAGLDHLPSFLF